MSFFRIRKKVFVRKVKMEQKVSNLEPASAPSAIKSLMLATSIERKENLHHSGNKLGIKPGP